MSCAVETIDLRAMFGDRYRIGTDPAAGPRNADPWLWTIPCRRATIYPDGGPYLRVDIDGRPVTAKAVGALPGVEPVQCGDSDRTYRFHGDLFADVARLVLPRRRRLLTDEQKAAAAARLAPHWFRGETQTSTSATG